MTGIGARRRSREEWTRDSGRGTRTGPESRVPRLASVKSQWWDLNPRPLDYESSALPLSYTGRKRKRGVPCRPPPVPWRGFEPRRLSALPPQDSVSTSFTTRARATKLASALRGVKPRWSLHVAGIRAAADGLSVEGDRDCVGAPGQRRVDQRVGTVPVVFSADAGESIRPIHAAGNVVAP